jgi:hypothetical protein
LPSLTDFLRPLKAESLTLRALGMMYYVATEEAVSTVTSSSLRDLFKRVRTPGAATMNTSDILLRLGKSGYAEAVTGTSPIAWKITDSGATLIRTKLGIPEDTSELRVEIAALTALAESKVTSAETRDFLLEAVACLSANALRATVVFVWSGAIWTVQEWLMKKPLSQVNAEIEKHQKTRKVNKVEDFAFVSDNTTLLAARDLGLWDKGQHTIVEHALDLRNQCGHPSRYKLPLSRCKSVIEEIITLVFSLAV